MVDATRQRGEAVPIVPIMAVLSILPDLTIVRVMRGHKQTSTPRGFNRDDVQVFML